MGFTPLDGVMMATRSGAIDPGILLYLRQKKIDIEQLLWKDSGWFGLTDTKDFKEMIEKKEFGDLKSILAFNILKLQLSKAIAGMLSVLNGADVILFTGGIGENHAQLRAEIVDQLAFCHIYCNAEANTSHSGNFFFHEESSSVKLAVIHTDEELEMAHQILSFVN